MGKVCREDREMKQKPHFKYITIHFKYSSLRAVCGNNCLWFQLFGRMKQEDHIFNGSLCKAVRHYLKEEMVKHLPSMRGPGFNL